MQIQDAVDYMSIQFLRRVLESYRQDSRRLNDQEARNQIITDAPTLTDPTNISSRLNLENRSGSDKQLALFLSETLLEATNFSLTEKEILDRVKEREQEIIDESGPEGALSLRNQTNVHIYREVLKVALADEFIDLSEKRLLHRLRVSLGLSLVDHYRLQAFLGFFPKGHNCCHSDKEISDALVDLQKRGIAFWCNRHPKGEFCLVPEDIAPGLKQAIGMELPKPVFRDLLQHSLTRQQTQNVLRQAGLPVSGKKEQLTERVIKADFAPSTVLQNLNTDELAEIARNLPGVAISGSKNQRIRSIIEHYDNLRIQRLESSEDKRAYFYQFLPHLARRDRENLLANRIINKDREIEDCFEAGTSYVFEQIFGLELLDLKGTKHADGAFRHPKSGNLFLWDNKSKEDAYDLPTTDYDQFKRYIRDSDERVHAFIVIVPDYTQEAAEIKAHQLKSASGKDTDICLITADNLCWLAEKVQEQGKQLNPDLFNRTGGLNRQTLELLLPKFTS